MTQPLRSIVLRSVRWTTLSAVVVTGCLLLQLFIATRVLSAEEYGLFAISVVIINFVREFCEGGIGLAVIHRQDISQVQLSSIYWLMIILGVALAAALFFLASPVASLYAQPRLALLLRIGAAAVFIMPFGQIYATLLQKRLEFERLAKIEAVGAALSLAVLVITIKAGLGVYALVVALVANQTFKTVLVICAGARLWQPSAVFRLKEIRHFMNFGAYVYGSRLLNFIYLRSDQALIGYFLGAGAAGYYSLAWNVVVDPVYRLNPIINRVCFPVFALVQDDTDRLRRAFTRTLAVVSSLNFPMVFGLAAIAPTAVPYVFGESWIPAVPLIQIMAMNGAARAMSNFAGPTLFYSKGRASWMFFWILACTAVQLPVIFFLSRTASTAAVALAVTCVSCLSTVMLYPIFIRRLLGPVLKDLLIGAGAPLALAGLMYMATRTSTNFMPGDSTIAIAGMVAVGLATYGVLMSLTFGKIMRALGNNPKGHKNA